MIDSLGRNYSNGHGRVPVGVFREVTNEQRHEMVKIRREEILKILESGAVTTVSLAKRLGVSISTINTDIRSMGVWDKLRPTNQVRAKTYSNHKHGRNRPTFREYQVLTLIKSHPGLDKHDLYTLYKENMFSAGSNSVFNYALTRLETLRLVRSLNNKYYHSIGKQLEFYQDPYAGVTETRGNVKQRISGAAGYHSIVGKNSAGTCHFIRQDRLCAKSINLYIDYNRSCNLLTKHGVRCGGAIIIYKNGINCCEVCGTVYEQIYLAEYSHGLLHDRMADPPSLLGKTAPPEVFACLKTKDKSLFKTWDGGQEAHHLGGRVK